jgi:hypothetical protein
MANGRFITNTICADKRVNQLSNDTCRLAFTWLVTFADREGRTYGDPAMVRSMLFPRRQDISIEQMQQMITEWASLGLVVWYEDDGDLWIWFPGFEKNQMGLRKEREAPSKIPAPSDAGTEKVRSRYGVSPELIPVKLIEVKLIEEKGSPPPSSDATDLSEGDLAPYERVFVEETQLPPLSGGPQRWFEGLKKIKALGASPEDFRAAIREQTAAAKNGRSYSLCSPASFVVATSNIVAKRSVKPPQSASDPAAEALRRRQEALYGATP